ncbi:hypothetical protein [Luedemannella helvata]|uniref:Uncharacterized protein n=1 Tax=Luedemannella helvata TaxID=349315 RepID=A0ABP4W1W7_9ACTN
MTNPATGLTIHTKSIPLGSWVTPRAEINGHPVPLTWGENVIPAYPGVHHIRIHMPWIWQYGKAEITVDNRTAPAPPVYYAPPFINFMNGAIGLQPVKNPGLVAMLALFGVPLLALILCCALGVLLGN